MSDHSPHWIFKLGIFLNFSFFIADMIVWQISGSSAIFGDSLHNGFHGLAHAAALWGHGLENKHGHQESRASKRRKFQAMQIIGFLIIAGAMLIAISGGLQIANPKEVISSYMLIVAALDIASNLVLVILLWHYRNDETVRTLFIDIFIDTLAAAGVIVGGIVIFFTGFYRADGIAALPIALIALWLASETISHARRSLETNSKNNKAH